MTHALYFKFSEAIQCSLFMNSQKGSNVQFVSDHFFDQSWRQRGSEESEETKGVDDVTQSVPARKAYVAQTNLSLQLLD